MMEAGKMGGLKVILTFRPEENEEKVTESETKSREETGDEESNAGGR